MFTHNFISQKETKTKHKKKLCIFIDYLQLLARFHCFVCVFCVVACLRGTCVNDILLVLGEIQSIWMRTLINEYKYKIHDKKNQQTNGHIHA